MAEGSLPRVGLADAEAESGRKVRSSNLVDGAVHWVRANAAEIAIVLGITLFAAAARLWEIGELPQGFHGDEAWTGFDAKRIVAEGWIGPYVTSALGQPTGPLYVTAALFTFLPDEVWTIRLSMALFGIAAVPATYAAARVMFNAMTATIAALLLSVMVWHLHLSRVGFMVISWTFFEMLALWLLYLGMRRRSVWLMAAAGGAAGLGVYTYNAYLLFLPLPFVAVAWEWARADRAGRQWLLGGGLVAAASMTFAALPMVTYVIENPAEYREHQRVVSVLESPEWKDAGFTGKSDILWDRGRELYRGLFEGTRPDYGDGMGSEGFPIVNPIVALLAIGGLALCIAKIRSGPHAVLIAACLILPFGALLTTGDGLYRRTLGLAPFIAMLAAIPLDELWKRSAGRQAGWRYAAAGATALVVAYAGWRGMYDYFGPMQDTLVMRFTFAAELEDASRYIDTLPEDTIIHFYSDRWSYRYETREYLAPLHYGYDRSLEFAPDRSMVGQIDYEPLRASNVAWVFLGAYRGFSQNVIERYPGGVVTEGRRDGGENTFIAYYLP